MAKVNFDYYEFVIAYNIATNETYASAVCDIIEPRYFNNPHLKIYLDIILPFFRTRSRLPNHTEILSYLNNNLQKKALKEVLTRFKRMDKKYDEQELLENTEQFLKERAVYYAILDTTENFSKENTILNTDKVLDLFENACGISVIENIGFDYFEKIQEHIEDLLTKDEMLSTGWGWLDKKLGGGVTKRGRALYIFSGIVNVGKSLCLGNLTKNFLKQDLSVNVISLEMSEKMYSKRFSGQIAGIPINSLRDNTETLAKSLKEFKKTHPNARLIIKEFPPKSITVNHIKAYLKRLQLKNKLPDVLVIDYLNLIQAINPTGGSYEDVKRISEMVRALSYVFEIPIISATQLNRDAYDQVDPGMETTSESMGTSMTCDAQISLWQDDTDQELGIMHLGIMKNRFGVNFGTTALKIDYDTLLLEETEDVLTNNEEITEVTSSLNELTQ